MGEGRQPGPGSEAAWRAKRKHLVALGERIASGQQFIVRKIVIQLYDEVVAVVLVVHDASNRGGVALRGRAA